MRRLARAALALTLLAAGCNDGGDSGFLDMFEPAVEGLGEVTGEFHGHSLSVVSAISARPASQGESVGVVLLSDRLMCDAFSTPYFPKESEYLSIEMFDYLGEELYAPTTPGDFSIVLPPPSQPIAQAWLTHYRLDGCDIAEEVTVASGTVTLEEVQSGRYAGSFTGTTEFGEVVTGAFAPEPCPALSFIYLHDAECR